MDIVMLKDDTQGAFLDHRLNNNETNRIIFNEEKFTWNAVPVPLRYGILEMITEIADTRNLINARRLVGNHLYRRTS